MKLILFLLLFIPFALSGQKNTMYLCLQPTDHGYGLRYEHKTVYASFSRGKFESSGVTVDNHLKASVGKIFYICDKSFLSLGVAYHSYGKMSYTIPSGFGVNEHAFKPIGIEGGMGMKFNTLSVAFRTGILNKWGDTSVELGINF